MPNVTVDRFHEEVAQTSVSTLSCKKGRGQSQSGTIFRSWRVQDLPGERFQHMMNQCLAAFWQRMNGDRCDDNRQAILGKSWWAVAEHFFYHARTHVVAFFFFCTNSKSAILCR